MSPGRVLCAGCTANEQLGKLMTGLVLVLLLGPRLSYSWSLQVAAPCSPRGSTFCLHHYKGWVRDTKHDTGRDRMQRSLERDGDIRGQTQLTTGSRVTSSGSQANTEKKGERERT